MANRGYSAAAMPADLVFVNGPVFTAGPARSFARALAVTGEQITAVGDEATVSESIGAGTRVVDLAGRMLSPGFQDAHCHPGSSGLDLLRCSFEGCASAEDAIEYVARYAADHPETEWILGGGWHQTWFPRGCPPKEALDAVVPDRPVLVYNADGHGAWANSLALSLAGVDASTPDPADGRIERNGDNQPQGTLHEGAAWLVERMAPEDTAEDVRAGLLEGQEYLLTKGITAWQDAHVDEETHRAYRALAASDELIGTAVGALWWSQRKGMEQIEDLERMRSEPMGRYLPTTVKLMLDGVVENFTGSMLESYLDGRVIPPATPVSTSSSRAGFVRSWSSSTAEGSPVISMPSGTQQCEAGWTPWRRPASPTAGWEPATPSATSRWFTPTTSLVSAG